MALTYLGVGKPQFTVTDGSTTILATYTLPSPIRNTITKITNYKIYMNAAGKMVKKYANSNTERWEITLEYKTQQLSQTDFDTILEILDYERSGYTITLKARTDNSDITGTAILKDDEGIVAQEGKITRGYDITMTWIVDAVLVGYTQNTPDTVTLYSKNWFLDDDYAEVGVYPTADGSTLYGGVSRAYYGDDILTSTYNASAGASSDELILREVANITRANQLAGNAYEQVTDAVSSSYNEQQNQVLSFEYDDLFHVVLSQPNVEITAIKCDYTAGAYTAISESINTLTAPADFSCLSVYDIADDGVTVYSGYSNKFYLYDMTSGLTISMNEVSGQTVDLNSISSFPLYFIDKNTAYEIDTTANKTYLVSVSDALKVTARKELEQPDEIESETYWLVNEFVNGATDPYRGSVSVPCFYDETNKRLRIMALKSTNVVGLPTNDYQNINKIVTWSYKLN